MAAHVLVVEDDEATRGALRALLDDAGYLCDEASDGERAVNPLSGLPGSPTITEEIESSLARGEHFALLYVDIDRFKEFNDHYGFTRGDAVITMLAEVLMCVVDSDRRFVGHIGGDDFVVLARAEEAEALAEGITRRFDQRILLLYD